MPSYPPGTSVPGELTGFRFLNIVVGAESGGDRQIDFSIYHDYQVPCHAWIASGGNINAPNFDYNPYRPLGPWSDEAPTYIGVDTTSWSSTYTDDYWYRLTVLRESDEYFIQYIIRSMKAVHEDTLEFRDGWQASNQVWPPEGTPPTKKFIIPSEDGKNTMVSRVEYAVGSAVTAASTLWDCPPGSNRGSTGRAADTSGLTSATFSPIQCPLRGTENQMRWSLVGTVNGFLEENLQTYHFNKREVCSHGVSKARSTETMGLISVAVPGSIGNIAGPASDGVLVGQMTATDPSKVLLKTIALPCLCITDDGGAYTDETTPANEATADDVEIVGTTLAAGDALYIGHGTKTFAEARINITTQGDYTDPVLAFKYWNGTAWTALSGVTDGTTAFEAATGIVSVSFTLPTDWVQNTVDSVLGYWIQISVTSITASVTPMQIGQIWVVADEDEADWADDTTDFTDAGAGDVMALPVYPNVGDGLYIGYSEKFCKIKVTTSQARTGTATITLKYWDGTGWTGVNTVEDDSVGYSATAGTHFIHFFPPKNWEANVAANGPNGEAGFFVAMELTAKTDVTQQPLITQGWVYPLTTGATGIETPEGSSGETDQMVRVTFQAQTASATNADSKFLLVNKTTTDASLFTWTKGDAFDTTRVRLPVTDNDELLIVQIGEDGTTEFADVSIMVER